MKEQREMHQKYSDEQRCLIYYCQTFSNALYPIEWSYFWDQIEQNLVLEYFY